MNTWIKHDGSIESPVDKETPIEVETWTATGNVFAKARELNWVAVKFYRIAQNSVENEREKLRAGLIPPLKEFRVLHDGGESSANGYQDASQKALDLYKQGHEPTIEIQYSRG